MKNDSEDENFAHFRFYEKTGRCEFSFYLDVEIPDVGVIKEDIQAARQTSDTISSLLKHIQNKLKKSIHDKFSKDGICIPTSLRGTNQDLQGTMKLGTLGKSLSDGKTVMFSIWGQEYTILYNTPFIKEMKLLPILFAGCSIKPKFYPPFIYINMSEFVWYKSKDKEHWSEVGTGFQYCIQKGDVDHYLKLKCTPYNYVGAKGNISEVISENRVICMGELPKCPFEDRHKFTKKWSNNMELRIVTYNILAERYTAIDGNYSYCEPVYLSMEYRKQLILKELLGYKADIICLQEVDIVHYHKFFGPKMRENSYYGVFRKKGNRLTEGLACFVRRNRYSLMSSRHLVYSQEVKKKQYSHIWKHLAKNKKVADVFLKQHTSLQVVVLVCPERILIVANTHLYYHPDANSIRLLQANIATIYLDDLKNFYYRQCKTDVHVIFCGDFNSDHSKSLYPFMIQGRIHPKHKDCLQVDEHGNLLLNHKFHFTSACGTPLYTNYTPDYKGCLDYIFVEDNTMEVKQVIPLPDETELSQYNGLPNKYYPSDHVALVADLLINNRNSW
ncbi:unnamed protein product [Acanthoscelides obtectus]|uniref:Endonuclease/exonuclease/phosphatase domain-containing protein n=2 Tax=Acanthoscelides obtectus TaxID=200917 RepID=A0A9P0L597_ACAOB|nr:unnamed protein product [Acanthoscelides obtectus]CAK1636486.1 2',5'-phosphodiesterase 12 [Acanthoscelides obtectus]